MRPFPADLRLSRGSHYSRKDGMCLLEAVAFVAGEEHSDHPACVCPVLGAFGRAWNDGLPDEDRQMLTPYIERLVGTRSTPEVEERRAWMATDWLVREYAPAWLRLAGLDDHARTLEQLAAVTDTASARKAQSSADAARAAARGAARAAARAAAGDVARDALAPTVKALQVSALALLDRMIEVTA